MQALQLAVGGIVFALLLAMAALGLSMIFGTTGLTNFAHGELVTFGALIAFGVDALPGTFTIAGTNVTVAVAIVVAAIASAIFGWVNDRALWRPLRHRGTGLVAMMVVSIGLSILLRSIYQYVAGAGTHQYSQFSSPAPWHWGPVLVTPKDVFVALFAALVLVVVVIALQRTRLGKATRAVADNTALSSATGINVDRVISVVWIIGTMLAGLSGVLLGMTQGFDFQLGFKILLLIFAATVLGGLGTAWGAIVGALIIGLFVEVSTLFIPAELKFVGALARAHRRTAVPAARPARQAPAGRLGDSAHGLACNLQPKPAAGLRPGRGGVLPRRHRPQRALRLHRTAQLRPGRLHGGRRLRRRLVRRDLGAVVLARQPRRAGRGRRARAAARCARRCGCAPTTSPSSPSRPRRSSGRPSAR